MLKSLLEQLERLKLVVACDSTMVQNRIQFSIGRRKVYVTVTRTQISTSSTVFRISQYQMYYCNLAPSTMLSFQNFDAFSTLGALFGAISFDPMVGHLVILL